jgi:hypothetical protein
MIQLAEVRSALYSPEPDYALDRIIRREQSYGKRVVDISNELGDLFPEIATWTDLPPDAEEALNGITTALAGWCHRDYRYVDADPANTLEPLAKSFADQMAKYPVPDQVRGLSIVLNELKRNPGFPASFAEATTSTR